MCVLKEGRDKETEGEMAHVVDLVDGCSVSIFDQPRQVLQCHVGSIAYPHILTEKLCCGHLSLVSTT